MARPGTVAAVAGRFVYFSSFAMSTLSAFAIFSSVESFGSWRAVSRRARKPRENPSPITWVNGALAALEAAMERLAVYFDQVAALLTRTYRPISSLWTPRPGTFRCGSGCRMVEIILSEHQLVCLKAAVPRGSVEHAALDAGDYFAGSEITPEPIAVTFTCSLELAQQLLDIAQTSYPDVAAGIRAAINQQTH